MRQQAIEILKQNFAKIQIKRAENATSEGLIRVAGQRRRQRRRP